MDAGNIYTHRKHLSKMRRLQRVLDNGLLLADFHHLDNSNVLIGHLSDGARVTVKNTGINEKIHFFTIEWKGYKIQIQYGETRMVEDSTKWEGKRYTGWGHIQCFYTAENEDPSYYYDFIGLLDCVHDWEVVPV